MRLKALIRGALGVDLPLAEIFDRPRLIDIAQAVESASGEDRQVLDDPTGNAADTRSPASRAQLNFWQVATALPNLPLFNMPMALHIAGDLRPEALRTALGAVVDRHPALRTHLEPAQDGEVVQVIAEPGGFRTDLVDLSQLPLPEAELQRARRERAVVLWPFDLTRGPLVHAELLRLTDGWLLLLTMHHAIADGWSIGVVMRDLATAYRAACDGVAEPWAGPPAVRYQDFARWQRDRLEDGSLAGQIDYWRKVLEKPLEALEPALDRPRTRSLSFQVRRVPVSISPAVVQGLQALGAAEHVSLFMVLATVFAGYLQQAGGTDDVRLGTLTANRGRGDVVDTVGLFMNTLVLRADLTGAQTFTERLRRVRAATLGAFANQDVPFEALADELQMSTRDRQQLFRHMLVLQSAPAKLPQVDGLVLNQLTPRLKGPEPTATTLDLVLNLAEQDGGLTGSLMYRPDLFDHSTAEEIAHTLQELLREIAWHPEFRISTSHSTEAV